MRVPFTHVFKTYSDGGISPRMRIHLKGLTFGPDALFFPGKLVAGFDIAAINGRELEIEQRGETIVIECAY